MRRLAVIVAILAAVAAAGAAVLWAPGLLQGPAAGAARPASGQQLRIAVIYVTPIEEPWNTAMHEAMLWARKELGIQYTYVEKVPYPDAERVLRQFVAAGHDIIVAHSWGYHMTTIKLAREFPRTAFAQGSGPLDIKYPPNVLLYDYWIQDAAYLAGVAAGRLTKSNIVGVVAGYPVADVARLINAFAAGARSVNPEVKVRAVFIESWYDPLKAKQAAEALISAGADVIYADSYGAVSAAEEAMSRGRRVLAFATIVDQKREAPTALVATVAWDLRPFVKHLVEMKRNGTWVGGPLMWGIREGWARLLWNDKWLRLAPEAPEIYKEVEALEEKMLRGELSAPVIDEWDPARWS